MAANTDPATHLTVLTGPPVDPAADVGYVARFVRAPGAKVICGGTTARIAGRVLGRRARPNLDWTNTAPPTAWLPGVGLVTEGVITIRAALQLLVRADSARHPLPSAADGGPALLATALLKASSITLMVGGAVNPAHAPGAECCRSYRQALIDRLADELRRLGKAVTLEHY